MLNQREYLGGSDLISRNPFKEIKGNPFKGMLSQTLKATRFIIALSSLGLSDSLPYRHWTCLTSPHHCISEFLVIHLYTYIYRHMDAYRRYIKSALLSSLDFNNVYLFKTALCRYNLYTIKFTTLKFIIQ